MVSTPKPAKLTLEISHTWAKENPMLAVESLHQWHEETFQAGLTDKWIDTSRDGFTTYVAEPAEEAHYTIEL